MNKNEIINYLTTNNVEFNEKASYKELLKLYYSNQELPVTEKITEATITEEVIDVTSSEVQSEVTVIQEVIEPTLSDAIEEVLVFEVKPELTIRERLVIEIVSFMASIKGKTKGTPQEINKMFELYNNYYKRSESPGCSICIGNVHAKMMDIYKKYK